MKQLTPKMQILTQTAKQLFFDHGIKKTSIEEICRKAAVSKMTFYKTFKNKDELAIFIVEELFEEGWANYAALLEEPLSFKDRMEKLIQIKVNYSKAFSKAFISDILEDSTSPLSKRIKDERQKSMEQFYSIIQEGQQNGDFNPNMSPKAIMFMANNLQSTMTNPEFQDLFNNASDMQHQVLTHFFHGISSIPGVSNA
jgi:AcrR family transcriptional regulator